MRVDEKVKALKDSVVNHRNSISIMDTEDYVKLSDAIKIVREVDEVEIGKPLRFTTETTINGNFKN